MATRTKAPKRPIVDPRITIHPELSCIHIGPNTMICQSSSDPRYGHYLTHDGFKIETCACDNGVAGQTSCWHRPRAQQQLDLDNADQRANLEVANTLYGIPEEVVEKPLLTAEQKREYAPLNGNHPYSLLR